jgi:hypothetical protein
MPADWREEYLTMIEDCEKRERKLSAWDVDFLESIKERLGDNRTLTPKQIECLDGIWEKATANG